MSLNSSAGPSVTRPLTSARQGKEVERDGLNIGDGDDLWSDILGSARRQRAFGRKNVLVLCVYHISVSCCTRRPASLLPKYDAAEELEVSGWVRLGKY